MELTVPTNVNGPVWDPDDQIWYCVNSFEGSAGAIHVTTALVGEVTEIHLISGAATWEYPLYKRKKFKNTEKYRVTFLKKIELNTC